VNYATNCYIILYDHIGWRDCIFFCQKTFVFYVKRGKMSESPLAVMITAVESDGDFLVRGHTYVYVSE